MSGDSVPSTSTDSVFKAYSSQLFELPLPEGHRFPMAKYRLLKERLLDHGVLDPLQLSQPPAATNSDLLSVHTQDYVDSVVSGELSRHEVRALGFPWSPNLVERSRRSVGATMAAARGALECGVGVNLAGGTHHAFADRASGYCVFNDVAVALQLLLDDGVIRRALVVDCDVHQGDGTATLFGCDPRVFTLSLHGRKNFPFHKQTSDLDVPLEDDTGDDDYLVALTLALEQSLRHDPDIVAYLAGADPFEGDRLGRLALSKAGLRKRDALVLDAVRSQGTPIFVAMAGGYAHDVADTVEIHSATVEEIARRWSPAS